MTDTQLPSKVFDYPQSKDPVYDSESQEPELKLQGCCSKYLTSINVKNWKKHFMVIYCALMETTFIVLFY